MLDATDPSVWTEAAKQVPALAISLGAIIFLLKHGMAYVANLSANIMQQQKQRDEQFTKTLDRIGRDCHLHATERQEAMSEELQLNRAAFQDFTAAQAKHEVTMTRVATALERKA